MEFNTDRNTEVKILLLQKMMLGKDSIFIGCKTRVSRSNMQNFWRKGVFVEQKCLKPTYKLRPAMCSLVMLSRNF